MIHTKRVNRERLGANPFMNRYLTALGGWSTLYFTVFSGFAGYQLRSAIRKATVL